MSPHLLPTAADLDDPLGFREGASAIEISDAELEAGLRELLDGPSAEGPDDSSDERPEE
jgi:hypothetical protein